MSKRNKNTPDVSRPGLTFGGNRRKDFRLIRDVDGNESWMLDQPEYKIATGEDDTPIHIKTGELLSLDKDGLVRPIVAADLEYDSDVNFIGVALEVGDSGEIIHVQNQGEFVWDTDYVKRNGKANEEFASVFNNPEYEIGQQIYLEYDNNVGFTNVTKEPKLKENDEIETEVHEYPNIILTTRKKKYFQYTKQYSFGIIREKTDDRVVVELNISEQSFDDQLVTHNVELGEDITINETCDPIAIVLRSKQCYKQKLLTNSIGADVLDFTKKAAFQDTVYTVSFEEKNESGELKTPYTDNDFIIVQYGNRAVIARLGTNEDGGYFNFEDDTIWDKDQQSQYDTAHIMNLKNQGFNFVEEFSAVADKRSDSIPKEIVIINSTDGADDALLSAIRLCSDCKANYVSAPANKYLYIRDHSISNEDGTFEGMDFANYYECPVTVYFSSSFYSRGNNITRIVEGGLTYENVGFRADFRQSEEDVFGLYFPRHNLKPNDVLKKGTIIPVTTSGKVLWNNTSEPREVSWKNIDLDQSPVDIKKELFCGLKGQLMNLPTNYWNGYIWCVGRAATDPVYNEDYFEVRIQRRTLNTLISSVGSIIPCDYDDNGSPIISNGYLLCDGVTPQPKKTYLKLYEFLIERFGANQVEYNVEEPDEYFIVPKFGFANGYGQILATPIAGFLNVEKNFFVRHEFDFNKASFSHVMDITPLFYKGVLLDEMESTPLLTSLDVVVYHKQSDGSLTTLNYQTYYDTGNSIGFTYKVYCKEGRYYMRVSGKAYNALQGAPRMIDKGTLIVYAFQKKYAGVEYVDLINKMPSYLGNIHSTEELYQKGHGVYEALKNTTLDGQSLYDLFNETRDKFIAIENTLTELSDNVGTLREDTDKNATDLSQFKTKVSGEISDAAEKISTHQTDIGNIQSSIADLQTDIQNAQNAIDSIADDVNTHYVKDEQFKDRLQQITADVKDAKDKTTELNDIVTSLEVSVDDLNKLNLKENLENLEEVTNRVDILEESLVKCQGSIADLETFISNNLIDINEKIGDDSNRITQIEEKLDLANGEIGALNNILNDSISLEGRVEALENYNLSSILSRIDDNFTTLNERVEAIENAIGSGSNNDFEGKINKLETNLTDLKRRTLESSAGTSGESSIAYKRILAESLPLEKEGHVEVDGEEVEVSYSDEIKHGDVTGADEYSTEESNDYPTNKESKLGDRDYNFQRGTHGDFVPEQEQVDAYSIDVEVNGTPHTIYFQTQEEAEAWALRHFDESSEFGNDSPRVVTKDPSKG